MPAIPMGGGTYAPKTALAFLLGIFAFTGLMMRMEYDEDVKWPEEQRQAVAKTFAELDRQPTVEFGSLADCTAQGFNAASCQKSQAVAHQIGEQSGTRLETRSAFDCAQTYGRCNTIEGYKGSKTYYPLMVGWQAAANDLGKAVPLFSTPQAGKAIRSDGKILNLNAP